LLDAANDGFAYGRQNQTWQKVLPLAGGTLTGNLFLTPATGIGQINIDPQQASQQAVLNLCQSGVAKWQIGKQTDGSFFLYDVAGGIVPFFIPTGGSPTFQRPLNLLGQNHIAHQTVGAGLWYGTDAAPDRFFVGTDPTGDVFRIFAAGMGSNVVTINGATGLVSLLGGLTVPGALTAGSLTINGGTLTCSGAYLALSSPGGLSSFHLGAGDNYWRGTVNYIQSADGATTFATIDANGVNALRYRAGVGTDSVFGDVTAARDSNTGVYHFGTSKARYLYFDGGQFQLAGGSLVLSGAPSVDSHAATKLYADQTAAAAAAAAVAGVRSFSQTANIFLNPVMDVSQQFAGAGQNVPANTIMYAQDQWQVVTSGAPTATFAPQVATNHGYGIRSSLAVTNANTIGTPAAADICCILQPIEHARLAMLGWGQSQARPITICFWMWSSWTGNFPISFRTYTEGNATAQRSYVTTVNHTVASGWQYHTVTIPGDASASGHLTLNPWSRSASFAITLMAGTNWQIAPNTWANTGNGLSVAGAVNTFAIAGSTIYVTGFAMYPGTVGPTQAQLPDCIRGFDTELQLCRRHFAAMSNWYAYGYAPAAQLIGYGFPISPNMRVAPAMTITGATYANGSGLSLGASSTNSLVATWTTSGVGSSSVQFTAHANARF
jgi:hypothetical protein